MLSWTAGMRLARTVVTFCAFLEIRVELGRYDGQTARSALHYKKEGGRGCYVGYGGITAHSEAIRNGGDGNEN